MAHTRKHEEPEVELTEEQKKPLAPEHKKLLEEKFPEGTKLSKVTRKEALETLLKLSMAKWHATPAVEAVEKHRCPDKCCYDCLMEQQEHLIRALAHNYHLVNCCCPEDEPVV